MRDLWRSPCGDRERIETDCALLFREGISGVTETNQKTVTRSDVAEEQPALTCQTTMAAEDSSLSWKIQYLALPLNILPPQEIPLWLCMVLIMLAMLTLAGYCCGAPPQPGALKQWPLSGMMEN